jgi:hypothetical protein
MELVLLVRPQHGVTPMRQFGRCGCKFVNDSERHGLYFTSVLFPKSSAKITAIVRQYWLQVASRVFFTSKSSRANAITTMLQSLGHRQPEDLLLRGVNKHQNPNQSETKFSLVVPHKAYWVPIENGDSNPVETTWSGLSVLENQEFALTLDLARAG